ncbi:MAG: hypothetical protein ACXADY_26340 [Candidatus Hodarchaeales archaeon]|jgi:hypothetical protein
MPSKYVQPVFDSSVRGLCVKPYPRHPRGCPNFDKKKGCPPTTPLFHEFFDCEQPVIAVWNVFDFGAHVERMRVKHPDWSRAQLECCLYWQGTARKQLKQEIVKAHRYHHLRPGYVAEDCPEAMGINITATMASIGVELEWPPVTRAIQVALLAQKRRREG